MTDTKIDTINSFGLGNIAQVHHRIVVKFIGQFRAISKHRAIELFASSEKIHCVSCDNRYQRSPLLCAKPCLGSRVWALAYACPALQLELNGWNKALGNKAAG